MLFMGKSTISMGFGYLGFFEAKLKNLRVGNTFRALPCRDCGEMLNHAATEWCESAICGQEPVICWGMLHWWGMPQPPVGCSLYGLSLYSVCFPGIYVDCRQDHSESRQRLINHPSRLIIQAVEFSRWYHHIQPTNRFRLTTSHIEPIHASEKIEQHYVYISVCSKNHLKDTVPSSIHCISKPGNLGILGICGSHCKLSIFQLGDD